MPDYAACTTAFEANAYIERCLDAPLVGVDTETTGVDRWHDGLVGICLSAAPGEGRYIPVAHTAEGAPNVALADVAPLLGHLLATKPMAMHGAPFDVFILWRALRDHGVSDPWTWNVEIDTQVAAQCIGERNEAGSDRSAGLKPLAKKFLGVDRPDFEALFPPKTKRKDRDFASLDVDLVYTYAAADADDTLSLVPVMRSLIQRADVTWIFESVEMPLLREMIWMEHRGVVVDEMSSHEQEQRALDFAAEVEGKILDYFRDRIKSTTITVERKRQGEPVEVEEELELKDSHLKVILHGEDYLNLPPMGTTATGQISLNEEALVKLSSHEPACEWVLEVRGARKAASTYFEGWRKHQVTETVLDPEEVEVAVIHPNYRQFGTETGRMSSSEPNVQNAPKEQTFGEDVQIPDVDPISVNVRDMIVPRPGHYFMEMDWAQVEARVIAGFSQEPTLLDVFARGIDYHKATYGAMYGVDPATVTKKQRSEGKTLNYALGFGAGPDKLAEMLGCSLEEAREKIARYWSGLPHYAAWKAQVEDFAKTNRYVQTYFGRKRFLDFGGSSIDEAAARRSWFAALREAVNTPIQGTAADLLKIMLCKVGPYLREHLPGIRTVFTTHDSVTFEVPDRYDPQWLVGVLDPVCRFDAGFIPGWPEIACDFEWGDRWGSLTEDDDVEDDVAEHEQPEMLPSANIDPLPEPAAPDLVLDVGPGMTAEQAVELRDFLQSLGPGSADLTLLVDDGNSVQWGGIALGPNDGHLFAHILNPDTYRFYSSRDPRDGGTMNITRGLSWGLPDGTWRKENLSADIESYEGEMPEGLTDTQKVAWVSLELEVKLQTLKWFYGGLDKESLDHAIESFRATQARIADVL